MNTECSDDDLESLPLPKNWSQGKTPNDADGDGDKTLLVLHQDAFAAGYDDDEYTLLGMSVTDDPALNCVEIDGA